MKAMRVTAYGSPDQLRLVELDDPVPGDNEVLIDVSAASVNPIDWKIVSGAMQAFIPLPLPFTPGVDAAGTVIAVGRSVTTLKPGDEVMGFIGIVGAFATRAVVAAARLARNLGLHRCRGDSGSDINCMAGAPRAWGLASRAIRPDPRCRRWRR
ncbi:alcohol dehydrogenase catalytic domain-containing protein [Cupriavidus taiwanensis]|uniref:alcohol dehydrogenase catalytic domain-containing protein n=1 Tax=Cupriavidus taiwanensis TaxID=164546 RepID=UPI0039C005FB